MRWLLYFSLFLFSASSMARLPFQETWTEASPYDSKAVYNGNERFVKPMFESLDDTDVIHYDLEIEIFPADGTLSGINTMTVKSLSLHLTEFTIRLSSTFNITSLTVDGVNVAYSRLDSARILVQLPKPYTLNELFYLTIGYNGAPNSQGYGSIVVGTKTSTLSEPWFAYTWWPAKDSLTDKHTVNFDIICPSSYIAVSNGVLNGVETLSGNRKKYRWSETYPIVTYLVSMAASNYNTWQQTYTSDNGSMLVDFYIYPTSDTTNNRNAWNKVVNMLGVFAKVYGEYPFFNEKYAIYQFQFSGGMEHQTCTGQGTFTEWVTAHEAAHQWWGDMVTCATWHDIWLNEGFATFSEAVWAEYKNNPNGDIAAFHNYMINKKPYIFDEPVYVYDDSSVNRLFDDQISYRKGSWVLRMLRWVVGSETFFDILAEYRNQYEYSSATTADFQTVCESVAGLDLDWFFNEWVYNGGAPAYTWSWTTINAGGGNYLALNIKQTQSLPSITVMPIEIQAKINGDWETKTIWSDNRNQYYAIPVSAPPTEVKFDPNQWILTRSISNETYTAGPSKIVRTVPLPGDYHNNNEPIELFFLRSVNTTQGDYALIGDWVGQVPLAMHYDWSLWKTTLTPAFPLPPDSYTLTIKDSMWSGTGDNLLDGEIINPNDPASLPSGNGVAGGNAEIRFTVVNPISANLSGQVALGDYNGNPEGQPLTIELLANGQTSAVLTSALNADGSYIAPNNLAGIFDIRAKVGHWLAVSQSSVKITGPLNINFNLPINGDANNDNRIDDGDIYVLAETLGNTCNGLCDKDMDGNGEIAEEDLLIIINNLGSAGSN